MIWQFGSPRRLLNSWHEAVHGYVDPLQFVLNDRQSGALGARTLVWEMEAFSVYWRRPSVGIFEFEVNPPYRRLPLADTFFPLS